MAYSEGLIESDCRKLEVFGFGQTSDRGYLTSLSSVPAYISRPLDSNRRAITRVFPGQPDDAGRNTLLLVSVILSNSEWIRTLRGDVLPLLNNPDLWQWDGQARLASIDTSIPGPHPLRLDVAEANEIVGLISEVERLYSSSRNVVISEPKYSLTTVRSIEILIPDSAKPAFSCSARSLSANLSVNLNCVARGVGVSSVGPSSQVYRPRTDGILSPYATELVRGRIMQGMIPDHAIRSYRGFGAIAEEVVVAQSLGPATDTLAKGSIPPTLKPKREPMSFTKKAVIGFLIFGVIAVSVLGYAKHAMDERGRDKIATDELEKMSLQNFAAKPSKERDNFLTRALRHLDRKPKRTQDSKEKEDAERLSNRLLEMTRLSERLATLKKDILGVEKKLDEYLSQDNSQPLLDEDQTDINDIITKAKGFVSQEIPTQEGEIQLMDTILASSIQQLSTKAEDMKKKIDAQIHRTEIEKMTKRLEGLIRGLSSKKKKEVETSLDPQYSRVMTEAKPYKSELRGLIEEAERAKSKAESDGWVEIQGRGRKTVDLMKRYILETDGTLKEQLDKDITEQLIILQNLDSEYTESLTMIFNVLKQTSGQKS